MNRLAVALVGSSVAAENCTTHACSHPVVHTAGFQWTDAKRKIAQAPNMESAPIGKNLSSSAEASAGCDDAYQVDDVWSWPAEVVAKIFFNAPDGGYYMCSGSFIEGGIVMTAGHCCFDHEAGDWNSNLDVITQYESGDSATHYYGNNMWVHPDWKSGDYNHDYCFVSVDNAPDDYLGYWSNYDPNDFTYIDDYGYPKNYDGGETMHMTNSFFEWCDGDSYSGEFSIGCEPMGPGCSGGPWLAGDTMDWLVGVNSNYPTDDPTHMRSPWFGPDWLATCQEGPGSCWDGVETKNGFIALSSRQKRNGVTVQV